MGRDVDADAQQSTDGTPPVPDLHLSAGLGHDEPVDGHSQGTGLNGGDELPGRDQATVRMVPPDQCLHGRHLAVVKVHDGLVVDRELLQFQGLGNFYALLQSTVDGPLHGRIELPVVAPAAALGHVHRGVGLSHQPLRALRAVGDRNPHAATDDHRPISQLEGLGEGVDQGPSDRPYGGPFIGRQQDGELVATQTGGQFVIALQRPQPVGDGHQQFVARGIPRSSLTDLKSSRSTNRTEVGCR